MRRTIPPTVLATILLPALLLPARGARADDGIYSVRTGDALSLIARRFGVSTDELRDWNQLEDDRIFVGQELVVEPDEEPRRQETTYVVQDGETLSEIALRFEVSVDQIREWNPGLDPDRIRVGQELRLEPARRRVQHEVQRGETLSRIADRYAVRIEEIGRWNPGLDPDRIRAGQRVVVYTEEPESTSMSIGAPYDGRLVEPVRLHGHPAYVIRDPDRAWGTLETVRWVDEAFDRVRALHPDAPQVRVHDISSREGGWMEGHRSHQTGRDVDISYYQVFCGGRPCPMWRLPPEQLDVAPQWTLLKHWLEEGVVEAIFIDYRLQKELYEHARAEGATRRELHRWFQYPRGPSFPLGIIRHYPNHRDHIHVRFVCPDSDPECE